MFFFVLFIFQILFVILKANGSLKWPWGVVFLPTIIFLVVMLMLFVLGCSVLALLVAAA